MLKDKIKKKYQLKNLSQSGLTSQTRDPGYETGIIS
jgi:hypothetical protein